MTVKTIVIQPGETLWAIAARELGDPSLWRMLYSHNYKIISQEQSKRGCRHLQGPNWIYPGTELEIS